MSVVLLSVVLIFVNCVVKSGTVLWTHSYTVSPSPTVFHL
jgi:hypothetical protein